MDSKSRETDLKQKKGNRRFKIRLDNLSDSS